MPDHFLIGNTLSSHAQYCVISISHEFVAHSLIISMMRTIDNAQKRTSG